MLKRSLAIFSALVAIALPHLNGQGDDYLSEELRHQVERLKAGVEKNRTTPQTYTERAQVMWGWANAYALAGGFLPVNLTTSVRPVLPTSPTIRNAGLLDYYVRVVQANDAMAWSSPIWVGGLATR